MKRSAWRPVHVVAIVTAVCGAAVLAPVAAGAAGFTPVGIQDPVYAERHARVSGTGQLWTTQVDPISKTYSRVDASGKQLVGDGTGALTIDGQVLATERAPATAWSEMTPLANSKAILHEEATTRRIALTSFSVAAVGNAASTVTLEQFTRLSGTQTCANVLAGTQDGVDWRRSVDLGGQRVLRVSAQASATSQLTFPTPLVLDDGPAGNGLTCFLASLATVQTVYVSITGI